MMSLNLKRRHAPPKDCPCCISPKIKRSTRSTVLHTAEAVGAGTSAGNSTAQGSDNKLSKYIEDYKVDPHIRVQ